MTKRDDALMRNAWDQHYAMLAGKSPLLQQAVPNKVTRHKSTEPTEHQLQKALIDWWGKACKGYNLPNFALFAVPNGSVLAGDNVQKAISMNRMKAEGFRNGVPDLMLCVPNVEYHGLWIEMKSRVGRVSPSQEEFHTHLRCMKYRVEVCRSTEAAIDAITQYLKKG